MPISLHTATVRNWLQTLGAAQGLLGKAEQHARDTGAGEQDFLQSRLIEDMLPLAYQFRSCWTHTAAALDGVRKGMFSPEMTPPPGTFPGLRQLLDEAEQSCRSMGEDELESLAGNDLVFTIGEKVRLDFTVQDFLLGFSTPNLHFHCTTAYDILRMKGASIGKLDYLGALPVKPD